MSAAANVVVLLAAFALAWLRGERGARMREPFVVYLIRHSAGLQIAVMVVALVVLVTTGVALADMGRAT